MPPPSYHSTDDFSLIEKPPSATTTPPTSSVGLGQDAETVVESQNITPLSSKTSPAPVSDDLPPITRPSPPRRLRRSRRPRPVPTDTNQEEREFLIRNVAAMPIKFGEPPRCSIAPSQSVSPPSNNSLESAQETIPDDLLSSDQSSPQVDTTFPGPSALSPGTATASTSDPSTNLAPNHRGRCICIDNTIMEETESVQITDCSDSDEKIAHPQRSSHFPQFKRVESVSSVSP